MKKIQVGVEGMTCSACSNGLEKYLNDQLKVRKASVNLVMAMAVLECEDDVTVSDVSEWIKEAGYKSLGLYDLRKDQRLETDNSYLLYGIMTFFVLYLSMAHVFHLPTIMNLSMTEDAARYSVCLFIICLPFLIFGRDILKSGIKNYIHESPNMDTLVSLGVVSSFIYSVYSMIMVFKGHTEMASNLHFSSIICIIYFLKVGRRLEKKAYRKTKEAIASLVQITPKNAYLKIENGFETVTIDEVNKGNILYCFPGDQFAVDGILLEGMTHVDESFLTGESTPVKKHIGDRVIAGSLNYDGVVAYRAERIGKDSTMSKVVNLVIEAMNSKMPVSMAADRICSYFVPMVMGISFFTFILSLIFGCGMVNSLTHMVTVLVVSCPCALGLATPVAIVTSEGLLARHGILVKASEMIELANKVDTIAFDKTGTLTKGKMEVTCFYNYSKYQDKEVLAILGNLESGTNHPISRSIMEYLENKKIKTEPNLSISYMDGKGIKGKIGRRSYYIGNSKFLEDLKIRNKCAKQEKELLEDGCTVIYIIESKKILGILGLKDQVRSDAKDTIRQLKQLGYKVLMITGDKEEVANKVAKSVGIKKVYASLTTKAKTNLISALQQKGHTVMMVGDGINDTISLVKSDIGVCLSSGTDIAADSADVILMHDKVKDLLNLFYVSQRTMDIIKENLFWAFIYNVLMIPIATGMFGFIGLRINPTLGSFAMILSSLFVCVNAIHIQDLKLNK